MNNNIYFYYIFYWIYIHLIVSNIEYIGHRFIMHSSNNIYGDAHLNHHKNSDTEKDPHSPIFFNSIIKFNLKTFTVYRSYVDQINEGKYNSNDLPRWLFIEKIGDKWLTRLLFGLFYTYLYLTYSPSYWYFILLPIHFLMGPIHGFIVNWYGHKLGYRNFDLPDNSKNTLFVDFLMLGELYQNNHHSSPNDPKFSKKWYEVDFGFSIIKLLQKSRIIQ